MDQRGIRAAETGALVVLFAWLLWVPLPFGSNVPYAWLPLIAVPLVVTAITVVCRSVARGSAGLNAVTTPWSIWTAGAGLLIALGLLQLVPLAPWIVRLLSPEAHAIWNSVANVAPAFDIARPGAYPLSVDPSATAAEVLRLAGLAAAFVSGSLLVRDHVRRMALAAVLCAGAAFQIGFALREAAFQRYEIWGWKNVLVNSRITGTFVNPNHFAHYLAIVLPLAFFLVAVPWRLSGARSVPVKRRLITLAENHLLSVGLSFLMAVAIIATILLSRSRGGTLALLTAIVAVAALASRRAGTRVVYATAAGALLVVILILYLGGERTTVQRFRATPTEDVSLAGRGAGPIAAVGVWRRFPTFGSGLGTFQSVVTMEQKDERVLYHRAHNDYAEIAATGGAIGFAIVVVSLLSGGKALITMTFGRDSSAISWRRRAFQIAALGSLAVAVIHSLFDFNFFIPSNPATLAVILGAAVAPLGHDIRNRR